jgi:hypothetical protein
VWKLDLKCLRVDLDDRTLTPLEKIAQVDQQARGR